MLNILSIALFIYSSSNNVKLIECIALFIIYIFFYSNNVKHIECEKKMKAV